VADPGERACWSDVPRSGTAREMSVFAEFSVPADQFALGDLLEVRTGIHVTLESMVPVGERLVPYLWITNQDVEPVVTALDGSPLVEEVAVVDQTESESLLRVNWSPEINGLIGILDTAEATLLEAEGRGDEWRFRVRFPEHEDLSAFYRACREQRVTVEIHEVSHGLGFTPSSGADVTPAQLEALTTALDAGYFAVPREITTLELAEKLGISDTAASQRLRRGLTAYLSSMLPQEGAPTSEPAETDDSDG